MTNEPFRLHLNGGPKDDTYLDHWTGTLEVASVRGGINTMLQADPMVDPIVHGRYRLRRDANNDLVPHNLQGYAECDWCGWNTPAQEPT